MAYIKTTHESDATGELAEWYRRVGNPDGTVDNVMKVHALNVDTLRTHFELYAACMHKPSPLSRADREMVAVEVSRLNGCAYCLAHHSSGLAKLLPDQRRQIADTLAGGDHGGLTDRELAMVTWAAKVTTTPAAMNAGDVEALKEAGLDDRAILDLAQCVGYFNYVNRIVTGLGVELGGDEGQTGQWPE